VDIELLLYLTFGGLELLHLLLVRKLLDYGLCLSNHSLSTCYDTLCVLGDDLGSVEVIGQVLIAGL